MKLINLPAIFVGVALLFSQYAIATDVEYKVKAGYLYNFTKFIIWPEDNSETFNLCIAGEDPFGDLIDPIEQRSASGRPIKLFRLNSLNNERHCHILFISTSIKDTLDIKELNNTLTVGENAEFALQNGMIGFINRDGKIKLQINLKLLQQSGLKISAKLLEVSELVEGESND